MTSTENNGDYLVSAGSADAGNYSLLTTVYEEPDRGYTSVATTQPGINTDNSGLIGSEFLLVFIKRYFNIWLTYLMSGLVRITRLCD